MEGIEEMNYRWEDIHRRASEIIEAGYLALASEHLPPRGCEIPKELNEIYAARQWLMETTKLKVKE